MQHPCRSLLRHALPSATLLALLLLLAPATRAQQTTADRLAAFLPNTVAGRQRLDVRSHGGTVAGLYEDSLVVMLQDRGTISPRTDSLLHHEASEGRLHAFSLDDMPAFQDTGQKLQIDIREREELIPPLGMVALVDGRFIAQVYSYSKGFHTAEDVAALPPEEMKARIETARTVLQALDLKGLKELGAQGAQGKPDFAERFAACQAPAATTVGAGPVVYHYELLGPRDGGCAVRAHFIKNPNPDWVGPSMTCVFDNTRPFGEAVKDMSRCNGPLAERMSP